MAAVDSAQCFNQKKTVVAVTYWKQGGGLIKINGCPIELIELEILRYKAFEPILLLGRQRFASMGRRVFHGRQSLKLLRLLHCGVGEGRRAHFCCINQIMKHVFMEEVSKQEYQKKKHPTTCFVDKTEKIFLQVCISSWQLYAIRQSIAKALVAFYQKYVDEQSEKEIKDIHNTFLVQQHSARGRSQALQAQEVWRSRCL